MKKKKAQHFSDFKSVKGIRIRIKPSQFSFTFKLFIWYKTHGNILNWTNEYKPISENSKAA